MHRADIAAAEAHPTASARRLRVVSLTLGLLGSTFLLSDGASAQSYRPSPASSDATAPTTDANGRPIIKPSRASATRPRAAPAAPPRPTTRDTLLRGAVGTGGGSLTPLEDDTRLVAPPLGSRTSGLEELGGALPDESGLADVPGLTRTGTGLVGAVRPGTPGAPRNTVGNNQSGLPVPTQPTTTGTTATTRATAATRPGARVEPVASARAREETAARMPVTATQPNPRDTQADKRVEAEKEDDGYTPLGIRSGGFIWSPAAEFALGHSSNINGQTKALSGSTFTVSPELIGKSDWSRHELQVELRGAYVTTPVNHDYDKPSGQMNLRGRVDLSEEMRSDVKAGWSFERQSNSTTDNPAATGVPSYVQSRTGSLGLTRDAGLIALTARGDIERTDYSGGTSSTGAALGSDIQNNTRWIGALRATVGTPGSLRPVVEVQTTARRYDQEFVAGSRRDSEGAAVKVGVVADLGPTLRGEMSTGWGTEKPHDGALGDMSGWLLDGTLTWSPTRLTVVKVTAKTDFLPTTLAGSPGALSHVTGVTVEQSVRSNVVAMAGATYTAKSYFGVDQDERDLVLSTGLTYKLDRRFQTFVKGSWESVSVTAPGGNTDYTTKVVMVGVRIQQ